MYKVYTSICCIHVLMRDEKEGRKKERSKQGQTNKQTKQSNTANPCT